MDCSVLLCYLFLKESSYLWRTVEKKVSHLGKYELLPVRNVCLYGLQGRKKKSIFHKAPIICRTMGRGEWELVLNVNENFIYERYY